LALVIGTCASRNLKIKHNKQNNNSSVIILLSNNMGLSHPRPHCEPSTPPMELTRN